MKVRLDVSILKVELILSDTLSKDKRLLAFRPTVLREGRISSRPFSESLLDERAAGFLALVCGSPEVVRNPSPFAAQKIGGVVLCRSLREIEKFDGVALCVQELPHFASDRCDPCFDVLSEAFQRNSPMDSNMVPTFHHSRTGSAPSASILRFGCLGLISGSRFSRFFRDLDR